MSRVRSILVFLAVFLFMITGAPAEDSSPAGPQSTAAAENGAGEAEVAQEALSESQPAEEKAGAYPAVIDRWTDPEAYPGFSFSADEDLLEIWFPRIRDRDAAILLYQGECWMIDCSDVQADERVAPLLESLGIQQVDRLFNTHPHHDHLDGLKAVDQVCPVKKLMICFPEDINECMINAVKYADGAGIPIEQYGDDQVFCMGDGLVRLHCWMKVEGTDDLNDRSCVMMVSCGNRDFLFLADLERNGEKELFAEMAAEDLDADIVRYPHHGKQAMLEDLFNAISPDFAVITSSEAVVESEEARKYLERKGVPTAFTTTGYLHVVTDGETWLCEKSTEEWLPKVYLLWERKSSSGSSRK